MCAGGPLVYDSVQLVRNSQALNGTQRVLLDGVISVEECTELKNLAHVRILKRIHHHVVYECAFDIFRLIR